MIFFCFGYQESESKKKQDIWKRIDEDQFAKFASLKKKRRRREREEMTQMKESVTADTLLFCSL